MVRERPHAALVAQRMAAGSLYVAICHVNPVRGGMERHATRRADAESHSPRSWALTDERWTVVPKACNTMSA